MKRKKVFKIISNILFAAGGGLAVYALVSIFTTRANLPAGVCPIDPARPLLYVAIGILAASLVLSFFTGKKADKDGDTPAKQ